MNPHRDWLLALIATMALLLAACSSSSHAPENTPQAGESHPSSTTLPTDIVAPDGAVPLEGVASISAGAYHTCAVTEEGGVLCWGGDEFGQLGNGVLIDTALPDALDGLDAVTTVAAGYDNTCAIDLAAALLCWGRNDHGAVGDGTTEHPRVAPVPVLGLDSDVEAVAVGRDHACAIASGAVLCWGDNLYGQLNGVLETEFESRPVAVDGLGDVASVGAGWYHTCALAGGGEVLCWGNNQVGQLGSGGVDGERLHPPAAVMSLPDDVRQLAVGGGHNCVLTGGGAVSCWGGNNYGQLGDGTTADRTSPVEVAGLPSEVVAIAAGTGHTCALTSAGAVWCWGHDWYGELGDGTDGDGNVQVSPVQMLGLSSPVVSIALGRFHTCVVYDSGQSACVGRNGYGELGDGTRAKRLSPVDVLNAP